MRQNAPLLVNWQDMKWQVNPAHSWIIAHKVASIVGRLVWHCVAIYLQEWRCKNIIKHVQFRNCSCILLASHFFNTMPLLMKYPMQWGNFYCLHALKASPNPLQGGWLADWQNSVSREVDKNRRPATWICAQLRKLVDPFAEPQNHNSNFYNLYRIPKRSYKATIWVSFWMKSTLGCLKQLLSFIDPPGSTFTGTTCLDNGTEKRRPSTACHLQISWNFSTQLFSVRIDSKNRHHIGYLDMSSWVPYLCLIIQGSGDV